MSVAKRQEETRDERRESAASNRAQMVNEDEAKAGPAEGQKYGNDKKYHGQRGAEWGNFRRGCGRNLPCRGMSVGLAI
ncbi:uncharacterized protein SPSK_10193 [Sporothrix schenckii 1099-18]|uniref:Uncharacterized protein n=1 Tax=Sporothrix schenckii 1099-18 TaxID=1397361 RepID=A0A0F2M915_SPOSC|nr:uncharacterized protein SPSK_10193 [Sporothrix schenckii 1099-18]KJR84651.1 hypothetical protein SPSK_10193 [Sporothrix schenckii 1099-18]